MFRILTLFILLFIFSCNSDSSDDAVKISLLDEVEMNDIYLHYRIHAEEGDDNLSLLLQFREGDESGRTLIVGEEGRVTLDGEVLQADSTERTGAYYEIQRPIDQFTGEHMILLEGPGGKKFEEPFSFERMTILSGIADTVRRSDGLVLELGGLGKGDKIRIVMTDTSFTGEEVNRLDSLDNGRLSIRQSELDQMHNGPVHLELFRETERPTANKTDAGGKFSLTYVLRRDFILVD